MVRGGAWVLSGQATTVNHRFGVTPGFRSDFVGFRVVRDLP
jgi:formylglycine-generating enzyme required for sulfatase activity